MHYREHDDLVRDGAKVDRVREPVHQRAPRFAADTGISERMLDDSHQHSVDLGREGLSEPGLLSSYQVRASRSSDSASGRKTRWGVTPRQ